MENQEQETKTVVGQVELAPAVETLLTEGRSDRRKEFLMDELVRSEKDIWTKQINLVYVQQEMPKLLADLEQAVNQMNELQAKVNEMEVAQSHKRADRDAYKAAKQQLEKARDVVEQKEDRIQTTEQKIRSYEGKIEEAKNYMAFLVENFK